MEEIKKEPSELEQETVEEIEDCECEEQQAEEVVEAEDVEVEEGKSWRKKRKDKKLEEEIIQLKEELGTTKNAYYKAYADTENLKKRLQNDADTLRKYRIQSFAQDILPVIDNLERAITFEAKEADEDVKHYVEGINMIYQQIKMSLEKEGVTAIESLNQPFDPNIHQALITEVVEGVESGVVVEEIQKGYMLKDRVLRASLVKVSE